MLLPHRRNGQASTDKVRVWGLKFGPVKALNYGWNSEAMDLLIVRGWGFLPCVNTSK